MSTDLEQQARELAARLLGFAAHQDDITLILAALKRVRDEGAQDTKRLDWLEANAGRLPTEYYRDIINRVPYRTAIDSAMRPTPEKESP